MTNTLKKDIADGIMAILASGPTQLDLIMEQFVKSDFIPEVPQYHPKRNLVRETLQSFVSEGKLKESRYIGSPPIYQITPK